MPVLPLEPFVHPDDLFTRGEGPPADGGQWWVFHTRPRAEKALARKLLDRRIPFFLPLYNRQRRTRGRLLTSYLPLFPSYLFMRGDDAARVQALTTNLIARNLHVEDQGELWTDLTRVFRLMASGASLAPEAKLQPGALVEITAGPLAGLEGKVLRRGKHLKLVVEVHFLRQGTSVEIDDWMIQPRSTRPAAASDQAG